MGIDKEMLEAIGQMMDAKLEPVCKRLEALEQGQKALEQGQKALEQQQADQAEYERGTRAIIENEVMRDIRLIAEQHGEIIKKLDKAAEVDGLKERIMTLERVALKTTDEIDRLKKAQ